MKTCKTCPVCGGPLLGDGVTTVVHRENADVDAYWHSEVELNQEFTMHTRSLEDLNEEIRAEREALYHQRRRAQLLDIHTEQEWNDYVAELHSDLAWEPLDAS